MGLLNLFRTPKPNPYLWRENHDEARWPYVVVAIGTVIGVATAYIF